jgi:nucleotide-binding universal stress UspA family protein
MLQGPTPRRLPDAAAVVQVPTLPFRAVVIGTDFSPAVHAAERYGALIARHSHAELVVVHAFTLVQPALEAEALAHRASAQREDAEQLLDGALADVPGKVKRLLCEGGVEDVIRNVSREYAPSLVVLGTHGPRALERRLLGSTAEGILRRITSPVLTVGPHVPPPADLKFRHLLCATDYSEAATHAESLTLTWAKIFRCDIDVLHVPPEDAGTVHERILERAASHDVDLIVLGAHRHSHLSMHLRTGPAFHVVLEARCPVLTISGSTAQEAR